MPDSLAIELKLTGVQDTARDLEKISKELKDLEQTRRGAAGGSSSASSEAKTATQEARARLREERDMRRELDRQAKTRQDKQLRDERQMAKDRKQRQADFRGKTAGDLAEAAEMKEAMALFTEFAGPIGLAVTALEALHAAADHAAAEMAAFRSAQFIGGGTKYETAFGETIGKALGFDGDSAGKDVARMARQFADRITSDPQAMSYANRYGVHDTPGANGKLDKMQELIDWMDKLRGMSDDDAAKAMHATGTDDLSPVREWDDATYQNAINGAKRHAEQFSPEQMRRSANNDAREAVSQQDLNDVIGRIGRWWRDTEIQNGKRLMPGQRFAPEEGAGGERRDAQQRQTTAAERTATAVEGMHNILRSGIYGGGERTQGAIPSAFMGAGWQNKQLRAQAHALGAFGV